MPPNDGIRLLEILLNPQAARIAQEGCIIIQIPYRYDLPISIIRRSKANLEREIRIRFILMRDDIDHRRMCCLIHRQICRLTEREVTQADTGQDILCVRTVLCGICRRPIALRQIRVDRIIQHFDKRRLEHL